MKIQIRPATIHDFPAAGAIMRQVQQLHIDWRPDIYKQCETVLPLEEFEQAVHDQTFFVAEYEGRVAGILFIIYRHIECTTQVTRLGRNRTTGQRQKRSCLQNVHSVRLY